ncbi:MAG TPA: hypothetical protein VEO54_29515 [Thermoanaerobaculia bacterium]|nr:hypothetical protein [Thermoanaerobaculia bacterium]
MRTGLYLLGVALVIVGGSLSWVCRNSLFTFEPTPHEIGEFHADAGTHYALRLVVESGDPRLNAHRPHVNVQLNGQELTDLANVDDARELIHRQARRAGKRGAA